MYQKPQNNANFAGAMRDFETDIFNFLRVHFPDVESVEFHGFRLLGCPGKYVCVISVPVVAGTSSDAVMQAGMLEEALSMISEAGSPIHGHEDFSPAGMKVVIVAEDLWRSRPEMMKPRLLAQFGIFRSVFARNTEVRRIDRPAAGRFLERCHTYGDAAARYRYGLFGPGDELLAVAFFSSPRVWNKPEGVVKSCEWVRYASLPDVRVTGGMGKVLKAFTEEVRPDDVMSYADMEWTDGSVYRRLGFTEESLRSPVLFAVDPVTYMRTPVSRAGMPQGCLFHLNRGSVKYRLRTGYGAGYKDVDKNIPRLSLLAGV